MNIEQLEHIVEVSKTKSISIAAQNLHVSQSGMSRAISNFEEELGIKVFKRSKLGTIPTDEGIQIIKYAYEALMKLQKIKEEAQLYTTSITGELKVVTTPGFMNLLLKPLSAFKKEFPKVSIEVSEKGTDYIVNDFQENKIDIGLITIYGDLFNKKTDLAYDKLIEGKMKVCVNKNSPLALSDVVTPQELLNQTFLIYDGEYIKWFVNDFCTKYGPIDIWFTSNNAEVIKEAIVNDLAIGFAPDFAMKKDPYVLNGQIILLDLVNHEPIDVSYGRIRSDDRHFSANVDRFINFLKAELKHF
ncbi:LysR family transcriptional regulator [Neobacillus citreus]|uniref:LysR family transcriptional regulator n=1 Tax=Neobacillus citreus TaxID=2833578 RepID=A0A942T4S2_9BACI|nr:LysR family transcriptional regulator [Neobacillus citreus]MCH6267974.1 LysR family transcriptional regulator [Neobacillus citreus]